MIKVNHYPSGKEYFKVILLGCESYLPPIGKHYYPLSCDVTHHFVSVNARQLYGDFFAPHWIKGLNGGSWDRKGTSRNVGGD
jgi:hypothetical protein